MELNTLAPTSDAVGSDTLRFEFGKNWGRFLAHLSEERIAQAENSLREKLGCQDLQGKRFLDVGSGSGLFSLAARRLGATVHSFDYDPQSVACTATLKQRFYPGDDRWQVQQGSVLDAHYLKSLGTFDVVYSWGVLHHTGNMLGALENVILPLNPDGQLYIAIYNDQGSWSRRWHSLKRIYNQLPSWLKLPYAVLVMGLRELRLFLGALVKLRPGWYLASWPQYQVNRGMSKWHDLIDWIGGYPFEVAKPELIFELYRSRGFELTYLRTCGGDLGCNEYVFQRRHADGP